MASGQLTSCDTFVVLAPAAAKNRVVFGKNSDRPSGEVQEVCVFVNSLIINYIEIRFLLMVLRLSKMPSDHSQYMCVFFCYH